MTTRVHSIRNCGYCAGIANEAMSWRTQAFDTLPLGERLQFAMANTLLLQHLTVGQLRDYNRYGAFYVVTPSKKRYLVTSGTSGNIYLVPSHSAICVVWREIDYGSLSISLLPDQLLMQALLLHTDEKRFVALGTGARERW